MTKFVSSSHPSLLIHDLGVHFVGGEAEVDTETAALLRPAADRLGIVEIVEAPAPAQEPVDLEKPATEPAKPAAKTTRATKASEKTAE